MIPNTVTLHLSEYHQLISNAKAGKEIINGAGFAQIRIPELYSWRHPHHIDVLYIRDVNEAFVDMANELTKLKAETFNQEREIKNLMIERDEARQKTWIQKLFSK